MRREQKWMCDGCDKKYVACEPPACTVENFAPDGIVQQATRIIKAAVPEMVVVTDVCLCEYTDHGHCGVLRDDGVILAQGKGRGAKWIRKQ